MTDKNEVVRVEGRVSEPAPNDTWRVQLDSGHMVTVHFGEKFRLSPVRLVPGDRVAIELSPYDLTRGRIVERIKQLK